MTILEHDPTVICFSLSGNEIEIPTCRRQHAWLAKAGDLLGVILGDLTPSRPEPEKA